MILWGGVSLLQQSWIENGMALVDSLCQKDNDFLLPKFTKMGIVVNSPMSYSESAAMTRTVMEELRVPRWDEESMTWVESSSYLLPRDLAQFWTEHSPRAVLPTAAQVLQVPKEQLNCLGRWSPSGGEDYARSHKAVVTRIQQQVMQAVQNGDPRLYEADIIDRLKSWTELREYTEGQAERLRESLTGLTVQFWDEMMKAKKPVEGDSILVTEQILHRVSQTLQVKSTGKQRTTYLIVYTRNRKKAKLHKMGGCQWTAVSLSDSQEVVKPVPSMYDSRCKLCWPKILDAADLDDGSSGESEL